MTDWQSDLWLIAVIMANIAVFGAVRYLYSARSSRAARIVELEREVLRMTVLIIELCERIDAYEARVSQNNREKVENQKDIWDNKDPPW